MDAEGLLFDLDGVLYVEGTPVPGAIEVMKLVIERDIPFRYITNTSTRSLAGLQQQLLDRGLPVPEGSVFSAISAAVQWLDDHGVQRICPVLAEDACRDFDRFELDESRPEAIVVGDIGEDWNYALLNRLFGYLQQGAQLIAVHRNRYWQTGRGLQPDLGLFVAGLEYAAGIEATVVGKPAPDFFRKACAGLGIEPPHVALVGDDIESDIGGAQRAGLAGILVHTGKYRRDLVEASGIVPDCEIGSVAELPTLMSGLFGG
ncbi:haloacid dehalogenase [Marinobacterium nitratireducens]|uniref:Haloacid dehalogenase-like hydrolase domain-containing protein 2 n=1 Tax=Marinobacterium nitratireducens TaxID=518897 RepID=A0A917ZMV2_9GAMM|nr:haloacid dehalogenase [Marinobacterium nitratireducens]